MALQQIIALSDLISSSVQQIDSLSKLDRKSYEPTDPRMRKQALQITAAASQLISLVRSPEQYILETAIAYQISSSLHFAIHTGVAEIIREKGHGAKHSLHVMDIALYTNVNHHKLARILRLLATHHIFEEVSPDVFANNHLSVVLDTNKSINEIQAHPDERYDGTSGLAAIASVVADDCMRNATGMTKTLLDPITSHSFSPLHAPFSRAWNTEMAMFEWLNLPENKFKLKRFGNAMNGMSSTVPADAVLSGFDWASLSAGSLVVDVGGGVGAASLPIVRSCPNIKLVIQDSGPVVAEAAKFWQSHYHEALDEGRVSFQAQDFFLPQPSSNAPPSIFLVRMIMHNWPDSECLTILRHLRAAASQETKLVLVDNIMMYACREGSEEPKQHDGLNGEEGRKESYTNGVEAPAPLLANWGSANILSYAFDVMMMCNHNAGERTLSEFASLLSKTGWAVQEVHQFHQSWLPQIVAVPGPVPEEPKSSLESNSSSITESSTVFEPESTALTMAAVTTLADSDRGVGEDRQRRNEGVEIEETGAAIDLSHDQPFAGLLSSREVYEPQAVSSPTSPDLNSPISELNHANKGSKSNFAEARFTRKRPTTSPSTSSTVTGQSLKVAIEGQEQPSRLIMDIPKKPENVSEYAMLTPVSASPTSNSSWTKKMRRLSMKLRLSTSPKN